MKEPSQRHRYPELAARSPPVCLPSIAAIEVDAAVAHVPDIDVRRIDQNAFKNAKHESWQGIRLRGRPDYGVVLIRHDGWFDLEAHVREVVGFQQTRFRCFPFVV